MAQRGRRNSMIAAGSAGMQCNTRPQASVCEGGRTTAMSIENLLVSHILVFPMFTRMGFCVRVIRLSSFSRVDPLSLPVPILSRRPHFLFEFPAPCSRSAGNDRQCMGSHGTGVVSLWRSRPLFLIRVSSRVALLLSRPLLSCVALVASCCIVSCLCLS